MKKEAKAPANAWLSALDRRYRSELTTQEFLKAVRALSVRYVERRPQLSNRSALDSAGKRAAFGAFYGPLHFFTVREILRSLGREAVESILDLGCGTGVSSAAWATLLERPPSVLGVDRHPWAVEEAAWTWRQLGLSGRARRGDLVEAAGHFASKRRSHQGSAIIAAWSANELPGADRERLLDALLNLGRRGASVLVVEPLARAATPWWEEWATAFRSIGGRADDWKFDVDLPDVVAIVDEAAGFQRESLSAKSLWV